MKIKQNFKIIFLAGLLSLVLMPAFVFAQSGRKPTGTTGTTGTTSGTTGNTTQGTVDANPTNPTQSTNLVAPDAGLVICGRSHQNDIMDRAGNPNDSTHACTLYDLFSIFARVINFMLAVAGFFAIFQIVRAGQSMVLAMGNPESLTAAKQALTNAVLGFALVLIAYVLIYAVVYGFLGIKDNPFNLFFHPIDYLLKLE